MVSYPQARSAPRMCPSPAPSTLWPRRIQGHIGTHRDTSKTRSVPTQNPLPPAHSKVAGTLRDTIYIPIALREKTGELPPITCCGDCNCKNVSLSVPATEVIHRQAIS